MYLIVCWSYLNHSLRFVGKKIRIKFKKSHIKSQSQYWGGKSQLDYFPKSFSPNTDTDTHTHTHTHTHRHRHRHTHTHRHTHIHPCVTQMYRYTKSYSGTHRGQKMKSMQWRVYIYTSLCACQCVS